MTDLYYKIYHNPSHKILSFIPLRNDILENNFETTIHETDELIFNGLQLDFGNHIRHEVGIKIIKTKL